MQCVPYHVRVSLSWCYMITAKLPSKYHRTKAIKGRKARSASVILISLERKGTASEGAIQGRELHPPCLPPARERIITGITNGACHAQPWQPTTCEPSEMMPMIMPPLFDRPSNCWTEQRQWFSAQWHPTLNPATLCREKLFVKF